MSIDRLGPSSEGMEVDSPVMEAKRERETVQAMVLNEISKSADRILDRDPSSLMDIPANRQFLRNVTRGIAGRMF